MRRTWPLSAWPFALQELFRWMAFLMGTMNIKDESPIRQLPVKHQLSKSKIGPVCFGDPSCGVVVQSCPCGIARPVGDCVPHGRYQRFCL